MNIAALDLKDIFSLVDFVKKSKWDLLSDVLNKVPLFVFFKRIKLGVKNEELLRAISFSLQDRPEMKL